MLTITVNSVGTSRREKLGGRDYIVVPMTMIVPGVLNGSKGPIFYSADENKKSVGLWNGMPIVVNHTYDADGSPISARRADVLNKQGIGMVLETKTDDNGRLQAEGWFDVQTTKAIEPTVYAKLTNGERFELSTGFSESTTLTQAPEGATYNGVAYSYTISNYHPDHLAVLPNSTGACSLNDGCGVLVNEDKQAIEEYKGLWSKLTNMLFGDKEPKSVDNSLSQSNVREALSDQLKARFNQSDERVYIMEVFEDDGFIVYEQGYQVYRLNFSRSGDTVTLSPGPPVKGQLSSQFVVANEAADDTEDEEMMLNDAQRKEKVDALITNCKCSEGKATFEEKDRDYLMKLDERVLNTLGTEKTPEAKPEAKPVEKADSAPIENKAAEKQPLKEEDLPEQVRNELSWARKEMESRKKQIIGKMVANVANEESVKKLTDSYSKLTLNQLEERYEEFKELAPAAFVNNRDQQDVADYSGASSYIDNTSTKPTPMGLPNWEGQFSKAN